MDIRCVAVKGSVAVNIKGMDIRCVAVKDQLLLTSRDGHQKVDKDVGAVCSSTEEDLLQGGVYKSYKEPVYKVKGQ